MVNENINRQANGIKKKKEELAQETKVTEQKMTSLSGEKLT